MMISKAARYAALLAGASVMVTASPASAQSRVQAHQREQQQREQQQQAAQPQAQGAQQQRRFTLSRPERDALVPLEQAVQAAQQQGQGGNWAAAAALLPAAQAAARGNDARYLVTKFQYAIAVGTNNLEAQEQALTALAASPSATPQEVTDARRIVVRIPHVRAERAFNAGDFATAERIYRQILQTNPNDQLAQGNLRATLSRTGNTAGALQLLQEQIRTAEANGGRATEEQYRQALGLAQRANQQAESAAALRRLLTAYPTPANWRLAVDAARAKAGDDIQSQVDALRFARVANVIQPTEYVPLANTLVQSALTAEAAAVLQAGVAARALQPTQVADTGARPPKTVQVWIQELTARSSQDQASLATEARQAAAAANGRQARNVADAYYGLGRFAEAADLYRAALGKSGADANLLNLRLGASLAQAGRRAEAEAALRAVTGPRADLAALWLVWLAGRQG
jgi:tetratricopeptide (TPR) repeat protein